MGGGEVLYHTGEKEAQTLEEVIRGRRVCGGQYTKKRGAHHDADGRRGRGLYQQLGERAIPATK